MEATESEIAPSVSGQSLKTCLPRRERGKRGCEQNPGGAVDGGRWWGNGCLQWVPLSREWAEDKH